MIVVYLIIALIVFVWELSDEINIYLAKNRYRKLPKVDPFFYRMRIYLDMVAHAMVWAILWLPILVVFIAVGTTK